MEHFMVFDGETLLTDRIAGLPKHQWDPAGLALEWGLPPAQVLRAIRRLGGAKGRIGQKTRAGQRHINLVFDWERGLS